MSSNSFGKVLLPMNNLDELLAQFSIVPNDRTLYERAFTHASCNVMTGREHADYERLEFMGDAVLDMLVAELAYILHPEMDQGDMSKLRALLVKTDSLAALARQNDFAKYIRTGSTLKRDKVNDSKKILEDVFEAFIGAVYLDQGFNVTRKLVRRFFYHPVQNLSPEELTDFKTRLQEEIQAEHTEAVRYVVEQEDGPAHARVFTVAVVYNDTILGRGTGNSKKEAEQKAAQDALSKKAI